MEESQTRPADENGGKSGEKGPRTLARQESEDHSDGGYDDIFHGLSIDEDTVNELMKLLEEEIASPTKMRFINDPYSSPSTFQPSFPFVTINGNEESCGSSFSDFDCSVMASIDVTNIKPEHILASTGEFLGCSMECGSACGKVEWEWDEAMFERFIGNDSFSPMQ